MKRLLQLTIFVFLTACSQREAPNTLRVAATPVPQAEILEFIKPKLKAEGIDLKIVVIDDYNIPNRALAEGEVHANYFQHIPFMDEQIKAFNYPITCFARIHLEPMGLYSKKIHTLSTLRDKASVALPNDPTNEYRALKLMEKEGLITLKPEAALTATVASIATNPKKLVFHQIDAPLLPRALGSVDLAVIPTNFALQAGLDPDRDALALESSSSPYANIIAVKDSDLDDSRLLKLRELMLSDELRQFIIKKYDGALIPVLKLCPEMPKGS